GEKISYGVASHRLRCPSGTSRQSPAVPTAGHRWQWNDSRRAVGVEQIPAVRLRFLLDSFRLFGQLL
ncbi:MAG: hypothetical protein WCS94_25165, partial [Verrucomicrobiota bacterium]